MAKNLKIVLVALCPEGGATRYIELLAREYQAQGHTVTVCLRPSARAADLRRQNYHVIEMPSGLGIGPLTAAYRILAGIVKGDVDVVHANSSIAGVLVSLLALRHPGCAYVFSPHCFPFSAPVFGRLQRYCYWLVMRCALWVYDLLICCCIYEWREAIRCLGNDKEKARLVYHGVPPGKTSGDAKPPVVVCISRLVAGKGLDVLIRSARLVVDELPSVRFEILGDGPLRDELTLLIESLGLTENVRLAGYVNPVEPWLDKAGVFCLPSQSEALPFSVLEAMTRGLPIVATEVGGLPELVDDSVGVLVKPGDPCALAAALLRFVSSPSLAEECGKNSELKAANSFDVSRMARETLRCYSEVVSPALTSLPRTPKHAGHNFMIRLCDIVLSLAALLLTLPIMFISCIAVLLETGLPVFYSQPRIGRGGRRFTVYKIRTMRQDAEAKWGSAWESNRQDPRATRVGRILRPLNIDELPQLISILRGDMSLVGPRPELIPFVRLLRKRIPGYSTRHVCRPGLTGWAQVHGYRGRTSRRKRLGCDLWFIRHRTAGVYLSIIAMTAACCLWDLFRPVLRRLMGLLTAFGSSLRWNTKPQESESPSAFRSPEATEE